MRQVAKHVRGVLQAVLICGMSVQILLGLAWLIKNMGGLQNFQESMVLLTGEGDGAALYSGALYKGLAGLLSSHLWILYGIQLAAALAAAYGLTACVIKSENRILRLLGAAALTTIPQALQCHLAVLPWSLGTSLLMGETALWLKLYDGFYPPVSREWYSGYAAWEEGKAPGKREKYLMAEMLGGWLLLLLILPAYAWVILPLLLAALWQMGKRSSGRSACVLAGLLLCLSTVAVSCGFHPAHWNRQLAAAALSRTGWPYFQDNYEVIPDPLHEEIGLVTAREVSAYADGVERVLIPKLEEQYGTKETTAVLWELAGICLRENLKLDVKNVIWDMAAYHATPPILFLQLKGRAYESFSGVNYEQLKNRAPLLTRYYVTYGGRWWWMMLALAAVIWLCERLFRRGSPQPGDTKDLSDTGNLSAKRKRGGRLWDFLRRWFPVGVGSEGLILCCVLSGSGMMDYKKTIWIIILWYLLAFSQLGEAERRAK